MDSELEVQYLYKVIPLQALRRTPGVLFDCIPPELLPKIDSIDRVMHEHGAISPGPIGDVLRPWYMHPFQDDHLMVLQGTRYVDIYSVKHGKIEHFEVSPNKIIKNGKVIYDGPSFLVWPRGVFHRIQSDPQTGSASINFATHYEGFDLKTNFSIYDLDPATGEFKVIREGSLDQPKPH